ncbi:MAG: DNA methyltransferase [Candidatus Moranbacteria bacterium]|nr:DNA methyltransferase [Candidatus Moranbacteria bacterium]
MANSNLTEAKRAKNDEFYTQYHDIEKEIGAYLEFDADTFRGKTVYANCDDPFESNFFRYFVLNFNKLGLKRLITTSYKPSPIANTQLGLFGDDKTLVPVKGRPKVTANRFIIRDVGDIDGDGEFSLKDIAEQLRANRNNEWTPLEGDGDFRSPECVDLLRESDIVVTNPPFSLFREYVKQLFDFDKKFLIIGNMNAITYKEVFPKIKEIKMWLGISSGAKTYIRPDKTEQKMGNTCWFTNLDHGRRHQPLQLLSKEDVIKFVTKKPFLKYDNYEAIEVSQVKNIPRDYDGVMGVPISFLEKYNPSQFEVLGTSDNGLVDDKYKKTPGLTKKFVDDYYKAGGTGAYKEGNPTAGYYENNVAKMAYKRIFIRHKKG